jgi:hypothetical protein
LENVSDKQRDDWLSLQGFRVLRFWNNDVLSNIEGVLQRVRENLSPTSSKEKRKNKSISPSPRPSPTRGEGEKRAFIGKAQRNKKSPLSLDGTREHLQRSRGAGGEGEKIVRTRGKNAS